jgi:hypothetical protein
MTTGEEHRKAVGIAERLYQSRETARSLLGDRYEPQMRQYAAELEAIHGKGGSESRMATLVECLSSCRDNPMVALKVMAAGVEWIEEGWGR